MNQHRKKLIMFLLTLCIIAIGIVLPSSITAKAAKVKLNKESVTIAKSKSITLKLKGTKKKVKWSTNNKKVATVTQKGKVTGKKVGTAKIVARVGKKKYVCKVQVVKTVNDIPVVLNKDNCQYYVKDGEVTIEDYGHDKNWTSIIIPKKIDGYPVRVVDRIGNHEKLSEVVISEGITEIAHGSFILCTNLTKIKIPNSVVKIMDREPGYYKSVYDENGNRILDEYGRPIPFPSPVVGSSIFIRSNNPNLVIYGIPGSFAEEFANKEGIPFRPL